MKAFYVYEHWRPDTDLPFYIGKGQKNRAYRLNRNADHRRIVDTLSAVGMCVEVRMVASTLSEHEAFKLEIERIAFWRARGVVLTNKTAGGDGSSGFVRPLGIRLSDEAKQKLSAARKGMKFSDEHRANLAARKIGVPRKPFTEETRRKMALASQRREQKKREIHGANVTRKSRAVIPGF